jgi:nucleotide-binding universal stress UspA family protein
MSTLLVAIDDSEYTAAVLTTAATLAKGLGSDVTVFHLRADEPAARGPVEDGETEASADKTVDSAVATLRASGVTNVVGRVDRGLSGEAANAILDVARDLDAQFIVMGHRGTGRLAGLLVGSVAHKVLNLADRPVVIVR